VDGHSLKLHFKFFCIFEDHKGNITVLIVKKNWIKCSKFDTNQKMFIHFQKIQMSSVNNFFFFKSLYFLPNVHHYF
jgi:hypothetical protein